MKVKKSILDEFEDLSFLTEKQQQVVALRKTGLSFDGIGKELGFSASAAKRHYGYAERRGREYKQYNAIQERNKENANFPITRGELKLILEALSLLERKLEGYHCLASGDWRGRLPYEYEVLKALQKRADECLYPPRPTTENEK